VLIEEIPAAKCALVGDYAALVLEVLLSNYELEPAVRAMQVEYIYLLSTWVEN
jgi:hypothetical protein